MRNKKRTYQPHKRKRKSAYGFRERIAFAKDRNVLLAGEQIISRNKTAKQIIARGATGVHGGLEYAVTIHTAIVETQPARLRQRKKFIAQVKKATGTAVDPLSNVAYLQNAANTASRKAVEDSKALGLPITYIEDGKIIEEAADGTKKVISAIE